MKLTFDTNKDAINLVKHNLSLAEAEHLDWVDMLSWVDDSKIMVRLGKLVWCQ